MTGHCEELDQLRIQALKTTLTRLTFLIDCKPISFDIDGRRLARTTKRLKLLGGALLNYFEYLGDGLAALAEGSDSLHLPDSSSSGA